MSAKAAAEAPANDKAKPKSKKMIIIGAAVALLVILGGGGAYFVMSKKGADEEGDEKPAAAASHEGKKEVPTYLALENMVVNLADPGGERFLQLGVTFQLADEHAAESVKAYLPGIRSMILMVVSQRTSEELLSREGKEKLATDVLSGSNKILGFESEDEDEDPKPKPKKKKKKAAHAESPLTAVLFANFIVQ